MKYYVMAAPIKGQAFVAVEVEGNEDMDTIKAKALELYLNNNVDNVEYEYCNTPYLERIEED